MFIYYQKVSSYLFPGNSIGRITRILGNLYSSSKSLIILTNIYKSSLFSIVLYIVIGGKRIFAILRANVPGFPSCDLYSISSASSMIFKESSRKSRRYFFNIDGVVDSSTASSFAWLTRRTLRLHPFRKSRHIIDDLSISREVVLGLASLAMIESF